MFYTSQIAAFTSYHMIEYWLHSI